MLSLRYLHTYIHTMYEFLVKYVYVLNRDRLVKSYDIFFTFQHQILKTNTDIS